MASPPTEEPVISNDVMPSEVIVALVKLTNSPASFEEEMTKLKILCPAPSSTPWKLEIGKISSLPKFMSLTSLK